MKESYFKFWWKSGNEHSVHSPFIFNLLTKGLYPKDRKWRGQAKKDAFISRLETYYVPKSIGGVGRDTSLVSNVVDLSVIVDTVDMILVSKCDQEVNVTMLFSKMHNDSVLVVDRRSGNEEAELLWAEIIKEERFTVTIDFYYFGVAYVRSEQLKQHFVLRM
ncbi:hypothetical protein LNQ81_09450 [Myroides sp. M-43]|uniref:hypothetical protein n=1 Tax=Myroides oncorhynchi TaxID=2893756 RepID=UPI001E2A64C9|nr:hypothetical protein [Myroides oncorhynchi]MCC9042898.1 hypothetical protein [Myroides oncorhynchi]